MALRVPFREQKASTAPHVCCRGRRPSGTSEGQGTLSQLRASMSGETLKQLWCCFPATQFVQTPSV